MIGRAGLCVILCAAVSGCTHQQLARSTVKTTGTVMDIQYRTVLNNLALLSCHPEALPSHIDLADGVVQISDEAGLTDGGISTGGSFALERFGPTGSRSVSEQWGTDAITDPQRLTGLQDLYRTALGLPPLPPPNAVAYLRRAKAQERREGGEKGGPAPPPGSGSPDAGGDRSVPIEVLLSDVPAPGWFCLGGKKDVPKDACYVGRYGDRYVWVMPDGVPGLARFTVTVLGAVKLEPGRAGRSGLAVTR